MGQKQEAWTPGALSSATYTIGRHLDNIEMPHLGPMDTFKVHIEVASTQRNATQRNTTGARDWGLLAESSTDGRKSKYK